MNERTTFRGLSPLEKEVIREGLARLAGGARPDIRQSAIIHA
jgi:hypothetical protein